MGIDDLLSSQEDLPEFYADAVKIFFNVYGAVLEFATHGIPDTPGSEPPPVKRLVRIRMSPQHALIFSKLLEKQVDVYQEKVGAIKLPAKVYEDLGLRESQ